MIRFLLTFFVLLSGISVLAQKSKGDSYYDQGKAALEKGDSKKSVKLFLSARTEYLKEGNDYWVLVSTQTVAIYYQDSGDGKAAEQLLIETIAAVPKKTSEQFEIHAKLQDNLAYTYLYLLDRIPEALTAYDESILMWEKAGKSGTAAYAKELVNRATTNYTLSQFQIAVDDMVKAIALFEKDSETKPAELSG